MSRLIILGTRCDPHVDRVAEKVGQMPGKSVFVLDYNDNTRFSLEMDVYGKAALRINDTRVENYLVWDRSKIIPGTPFYIRGDEQCSGFAAQEWRSFYSLICGLNAEKVVNSQASRVCMIKPRQQAVAARVGFQVPPTLITNEKSHALAFQSDHGTLISKSVSGGKVKPAGEGESIPYIIMTMRIPSEDLMSAEEQEIAYCPHFFQMEIEKSYELRIVYIDGEIFPFKVDSQKYRATQVDWRKGSGTGAVAFSPCDLTEEIIGQIRRFMDGMGLFTGSLDLVVDKHGEQWFLECNQDGAWAWLDNLVDGKIAQAFADAFARRMDEISPPTSLTSTPVQVLA